MRSVVQRVTRAKVSVNGETVGQIDAGLVALIGVEQGDEVSDAEFLANKIVDLRIFEDDEGKMNRSLIDCGGKMLAISQFTLLGDCRKGRRPSFVSAAAPENGHELYEKFIELVEGRGVAVEKGRFRADMQVELVNDGPVTILLDSRKTF